MSYKICIDCGHGGSDTGAAKGDRYEKDDVLKLGLKVRDQLKKYGVSVIMPREKDKDVTINERCAMANNEKCDYFLSIHRNSASESATGNEIWVYSKAPEKTITCAQSVLDAVCKVDKAKNRGVKKGAAGFSDYGVNKYTTMPAALLELGFISNSKDNEVFDKNIAKYAGAIAGALCEIFDINVNNLSETEEKTKVNPYKKPSYNVKKGSKGEGARWVQWELVRHGYDIGKFGIDGIVGAQTDTAIRAFQRDHSLAVDGIVGKNTRAKLAEV